MYILVLVEDKRAEEDMIMEKLTRLFRDIVSNTDNTNFRKCAFLGVEKLQNNSLATSVFVTS